MSYPYGQPEYPGYGYPPAGYPPPGYPPYGYQEPRPSGGAAITAGIFALLLALLASLGIIGLLSAAASLNRHHSYGSSYSSHSSGAGNIFYVFAAVDGAIALLWAVGGIMLMNHKNAGRVLLIVLSSLGLLGGIAGMVMAFANGVPEASIGGIIGLLIAVLMLSLTLSGSAKRWCGAGMPAYAPAGYYGQPPYPY